ncbi:hypothetical protein [Halorubrum distributum]|nr:hypothetical protein [Halorubrum litoreum]
MTNQVATYPTDEQLARWKNRADERGMSLSQWVSHMVEGGQKKFEIEVTPDETSSELREQRNQLRRERDRARKRATELERQLFNDERQEIIDFVQQSPGVDQAAVHQQIIETASDRVPDQLDSLEGRKLVKRDGVYYPMEDA